MKRLSLVVFALCALLATSSPAQTELPTFTGEKVIVRGTDDVFDPVRETIRQVEAKSPRRYYVVVLSSAGKWTTGDVQLVEQLHRNWVADQSRNPRDFNASNSVLILVAIEQRTIEVRVGQDIQQRFGLGDTRLSNDLVPKYFMPAARDGNLVGGLDGLIDGIEKTIADQLAAEAARQRLLYRYLPFGIIGLITLIVVAVLGIYFWRRVRQVKRAGEAFAAFNTRLIELMEQCDSLKQQHSLLPYSDKDFTEPMAGATAALYEGIEKKLADLREKWLKLMDVRTDVERLIATHNLAAGDSIKEALRILKERGAFPNVDALYDQCRRDLETLGQAHENAAAALATAQHSLAELPARVEAIRNAGLVDRIYEEQRAAIEQQVTTIAAQLTADPIGAREALAAIQQRLSEVHARSSQLLELDAAWRQSTARRGELLEKISAERAGGLKLDEPGANPDEPVAAMEGSLNATREALLAERLDDAKELLEAAAKAGDGAVAMIVQVHAAREKCQRELGASAPGGPNLRGAAEQALRELTRDYAPASWGVVSENLTQAVEREQFAAAARAQAKELAADERQHYVAAAAQLDAATASDTEQAALETAVIVRRDELNALREACSQQRGAMLDDSRQLLAYLRQHEETIDQEAQTLFAEAAELEEQAVAEFDSARPDWPAVKQRLDRLAETLSAARSAAEADVRDRGAFEATLAESERLAARVEQTLRSNTADRPRANDAYRRASAALTRLHGRRGEWKRLLGEVEGAKQDLLNAEKWATEDIQLFAQAAQAITAAERAVGAARSFVSHGISAESALASTALQEANRLLHAQQYEHAITQAGSAEQSARLAIQQAEEAARMRQLQQDAERRRRQAHQMPTGPVVIPNFPSFPINLGGGGSSSPSPGQASSNTWSAPRAASGNWSGSASHNTW